MPYGFSVLFRDDRGYVFRYFAKYSSNEEEARQEYRLEALRRGFQPRFVAARPATRAEWEGFDIHGDAWHSPNAKFGKPRRSPK